MSCDEQALADGTLRDRVKNKLETIFREMDFELSRATRQVAYRSVSERSLVSCLDARDRETMSFLNRVPRYDQEAAEALLASDQMQAHKASALCAHISMPGALSRAVRSGHTRVTQLLLANGHTPMYINLLEAVERDHAEIVSLLLNAGAISLMSVKTELIEMLCHKTSSSSLDRLMSSDQKSVARRRLNTEFVVDLMWAAHLVHNVELVDRLLVYPEIDSYREGLYVHFLRTLERDHLLPEQALEWLTAHCVPEVERDGDDSSSAAILQAYIAYFEYLLYDVSPESCTESKLGRRLIEAQRLE